MKSSEKPTRPLSPDPVLDEAVRSASAEGTLSCDAAFEVAERLDRTPADVGRAADRIGSRLTRCQLGLFGYRPEKKIVQPQPPGRIPGLENAIRNAMVSERLSCRSAWDVAADLGISRMAVSAACEALQVKIKPCQLGAF